MMVHRPLLLRPITIVLLVALPGLAVVAQSVFASADGEGCTSSEPCATWVTLPESLNTCAAMS